MSTTINNYINRTLNGTGLERAFALDGADIAFLIQAMLCLCTSMSLFVFIIMTKNLRFKNSHKFTMNLQIIHMLLCITCIVMRLTPKVPIILITGFLMQMFFSLILITADRFFAIERPFLYQKLTTKKTIMVILTSWFLTSSFIFLSFVFKLALMDCIIASAALLILATISLSASNLKIYCIARRHAKVIKEQKSCLNKQDQRKEMRVLKSTYVTFTIIASFILLWFPAFVYYILVFLKKDTLIFFKVAMQISCLEALVDPILYVCCHKDVKKEAKKKLFKISKKKQKDGTTMEMTSFQNSFTSHGD